MTKRYKHERAAKFSLIYMQTLLKFRESQVEKETDGITDYHRNVAKKVMNEFPEMLAKGLNEANQVYFYNPLKPSVD